MDPLARRQPPLLLEGHQLDAIGGCEDPAQVEDAPDKAARLSVEDEAARLTEPAMRAIGTATTGRRGEGKVARSSLRPPRDSGHMFAIPRTLQTFMPLR
eukprot:4152828-Prymnesium_polylepis.1